VGKTSICEEKQRLLGLHEEHTRALSAAITALHQQMGTSPQARYAALRQAVEDARAESERSRMLLAQHVSSHRC
jgi:hypothetical protein